MYDMQGIMNKAETYQKKHATSFTIFKKRLLFWSYTQCQNFDFITDQIKKSRAISIKYADQHNMICQFILKYICRWDISTIRFWLNDDNIIVIFCTDDEFIYLENSNTILVDRTFKSHASGFKQLYSFVTHINRKYFPFIFILMWHENRKHKKIIHFFSSKGSKVSSKEYNFGFEMAEKNAVSNKFTESSIYGCLFHFSQNIWRKIQDLKLVLVYKSIQCVW